MCLFVAHFLCASSRRPSGANGGGTTAPKRAWLLSAACPPLFLTRNLRTKRVARFRAPAISFFAPIPSDNRPEFCLRAQRDDTESRAPPGSSHTRVPPRALRPACPTLSRLRHTKLSRRRESRAASPKPGAETQSP